MADLAERGLAVLASMPEGRSRSGNVTCGAGKVADKKLGTLSYLARWV
jgi:hypothetical protein